MWVLKMSRECYKCAGPIEWQNAEPDVGIMFQGFWRPVCDIEFSEEEVTGIDPYDEWVESQL